VVGLPAKRQAAQYLEAHYAVSERHVCQVLELARTTKRRLLQRAVQDQALRAALHRLSERYPRFGYRKIHVKLREAGHVVGRERVRRLRQQEGLGVSQKPRKRRVRGTTTTSLTRAQAPHQVWSYDFILDQTADSQAAEAIDGTR
jgi:hypothetical protein